MSYSTRAADEQLMTSIDGCQIACRSATPFRKGFGDAQTKC